MTDDDKPVLPRYARVKESIKKKDWLRDHVKKEKWKRRDQGQLAAMKERVISAVQLSLFLSLSPSIFFLALLLIVLVVKNVVPLYEHHLRQ